MEIIQGDVLKIIETFEHGTFDAIITDPPYSSGGRTISEKQKTTTEKYTCGKKNYTLPSFEGDNKDQRSWASWMAQWMGAAREICKPGAPIVLFCDWRQLPALTDALQWAGWLWRGIAVWDKIHSRPQLGRFRQQAEFIVWGSNGNMPIERNAPVIPGVLRFSAPASNKRVHQTQKSLELMRDLVKICEKGGHILDPFAGSGTTLLAAKLEGYEASGIELSKAFAKIALERLEGEV